MNTTTIPVRPFAILKLATIAALALGAFFFNACHWSGVQGNGHIVTDTRTVAEFTELEADGAFTINWVPGPAKLNIRTDENLLRYIRTSENGGKLHIEWEKALRATKGINVDLSTTTLARVNLNGAVRFNASKLAGAEFYLTANGATRSNLNGNVNAVSAELNGASRLDAEDLATRAMELTIAGAGRADVTVAEALKVDISGAGKVTYGGNPTVSKDISGAGSVSKRD